MSSLMTLLAWSPALAGASGERCSGTVEAAVFAMVRLPREKDWGVAKMRRAAKRADMLASE